MKKTIIFLLFAILLTQISNLSFGRFTVNSDKYITVSGLASQDQSNQLATFNANVSHIGTSKEEVNTAMQEIVSTLVASAEEFGINKADIKTNYFNIYQEEITDYDSGDPTVRKGPWRGNTNVSFSKVAAERAGEFSDLLVNSGASSIDGPNFTVADPESLDAQLSIKAIENAREKADEIAESVGMRVGVVLSINESSSGSSGPIYYAREMGAGGGDGFNPGSSEISKTVVVTYSLR